MAKPGVQTPRLSAEAQRNVVNYVTTVMGNHRMQNELRGKMEAIDIAYARYKLAEETGTSSGQDVRNTACNVFSQDDVTAPIVVSQVDSVVAYLAEVFLSGTPIFPVVSTPKNKEWAEKLEVLLDDHALLGGYPRQLLMFIRDAVKYNLGAVEVDWTSIDQFKAMDDFTSSSGSKIDRTKKYFSRLNRIDPYNFVYDPDVLPGDISEKGDYAGYVEVESPVKLKRRLLKLHDMHKVYNEKQALSSAMTGGGAASYQYYTQHPQISQYIAAQEFGKGIVNWDAYAAGMSARKDRILPNGGHEVITLYARILPGDFAISAPQPNTPQIWKFIVVNGIWLVYAERIISAYDYLPILVGQPQEDGLRYQTQSIAESEIPFQEAASTLFNIRFAAARRAVSDRALYIPDMVSPHDVNNAGAAPKIPVRISSLSNKTLEDAYKQIPFDMRGTETAISDAQVIVEFSKQLHGQNSPRQGQFQKGNKSVQEWNDTMGGSEGRSRLPALALEYQFFSPLKSMLALNIFQYGDDTVIVSQKTGDVLDINIGELRKQVLSFKIADGYSPKSKLASTEMLTTGMQMVLSSEVLQQQYGASLPDMFAHLMSLGGVKGLEEYSPSYKQKMAAEMQPPGLQQNTLQPVAPATMPPAASPAASPTAPASEQNLPVA